MVAKESDGYYHSALVLFFTPIAALICALIPFGLTWYERGGMGAMGCLLGIFLSPDSDQPTNIGRQLPLKVIIIGRWVLAPLWATVLAAYSIVMHHRGQSHWPIWGTLVRAIYLFAWISLGWYGIYHEWTIQLALPFKVTVAPVVNQYWIHGLYLILGLTIADLTHVGRDGLLGQPIKILLGFIEKVC